MNPKTPRPRNWFKRFAVALAVTGVIGQVLVALAFVTGARPASSELMDIHDGKC
jgi:hypothetical protein